MEFWLWILIGSLCCVIMGLSIKVILMRKSIQEIENGLADEFITDSNVLIAVSSRDPYIKRLAECLNGELRSLRRERRRLQHGDLELKEAITNVAHDLRTPLTAVCGYLDLLKSEEHSQTVRRYLSLIENRTEALKCLTEEMFRYSVVSSKQDFRLEPMDLRRVLEESLLSFYGAMQEQNITPVVRIPEHAVRRVLEPAAVNRIFENIISNALKYSDGDFEVFMEESGTIVFANTAIGLTPVTIERLFDRFYTVETGRNSTGLGLSIAKLLTERMGGTIYADYHNARLYISVSFPAT